VVVRKRRGGETENTYSMKDEGRKLRRERRKNFDSRGKKQERGEDVVSKEEEEGRKGDP